MTDNQRTAYVTVRTEGVVKVLDLTTDPPTVTDTVPIGSQPDTRQLTNDNKTLVVALRGAPAATLTDTRTLETRTIPTSGTMTGRQWLSANGRYTFLATIGASGQAGVAVIDNRTAVVVRTYLLPGTADPTACSSSRPDSASSPQAPRVVGEALTRGAQATKTDSAPEADPRQAA